MDKKVIPPTSSSQEKACQYSTDRASIINNRRRSIYKQLSSDKKEALLLQRRRRYQQLRNKNLLGRAPTPLPDVQLHFTGEKGDTSHIDTSAVVSGKAKDMIGCLSIFEVGSTSAAPVKQHNPIEITVTTKGFASLAHQQYDPKAITDKNNGGGGKTFLYRALLATVRSKGFIALATTTSGVAASILPGGRTAHSRFKIPINIDEQFSCNIIWIERKKPIKYLIHWGQNFMFPHHSPVKKQLLLNRSLRIITNTIFKACKIAKKGEKRCRGRRKKHSYRMMMKREDAEEFGKEGD